MRAVPQLPQVHFFVCANRREADAPLGPGCGDAGEAVYLALKDEVARRREYQRVWVTQTRCLGICPKGATVAVYAAGRAAGLLTEVAPTDGSEVFAKGLALA